MECVCAMVTRSPTIEPHLHIYGHWGLNIVHDGKFWKCARVGEGGCLLLSPPIANPAASVHKFGLPVLTVDHLPVLANWNQIGTWRSSNYRLDPDQKITTGSFSSAHNEFRLNQNLNSKMLNTKNINFWRWINPINTHPLSPRKLSKPEFVERHCPSDNEGFYL